MVFFRADSNSTIAGGHIIRCVAIAKALINAGKEVCFLVADENPVSVLEEAGIKYILLNSDWQNLMSDMHKVKDILGEEKLPILVIDSYSVTRKYVEFLKPSAKLIYLGSKQEYLGDLDLLINYSTDIDYNFYKQNYSASTKLLLGPKYAPLREEFQSKAKRYKDRIERVLLTTGNTDRDNTVGAILQKLMPVIDGTGIVIDVVIGRMFDRKAFLLKTYDNNSCLCFHENVRSMASLMNSCDLAISANGTTVYELSSVGLPTITFAMVPEQIKSAEALADLGVVDYCGRSFENQNACAETIRDRFIYYLKHNREMVCLAQKAHALIDGNGCHRIADEIVILA